MKGGVVGERLEFLVVIVAVLVEGRLLIDCVISDGIFVEFWFDVCPFDTKDKFVKLSTLAGLIANLVMVLLVLSSYLKVLYMFLRCGHLPLLKICVHHNEGRLHMLHVIYELEEGFQIKGRS